MFLYRVYRMCLWWVGCGLVSELSSRNLSDCNLIGGSPYSRGFPFGNLMLDC